MAQTTLMWRKNRENKNQQEPVSFVQLFTVIRNLKMFFQRKTYKMETYKMGSACNIFNYAVLGFLYGFLFSLYKWKLIKASVLILDWYRDPWKTFTFDELCLMTNICLLSLVLATDINLKLFASYIFSNFFYDCTIKDMTVNMVARYYMMQLWISTSVLW
jgi:hypothetical protein